MRVAGNQETVKNCLQKHTPQEEEMPQIKKTSIKFGAQLSPGMPFVRR